MSLIETPIESDGLPQLWYVAEQLGLHRSIFTRDRWLACDLSYWCFREVRGTGLWPDNDGPYVPDWSYHAEHDPIYKVTVRGDGSELSKLSTWIGQDWPNHVFEDRTSETGLELTPIHTSKLHAMRAICAEARIELRDVLFIGDGSNDESLLAQAGWGVAMDTAPSSVRATANEVTVSSDSDGVGIILRKFFPTGERTISSNGNDW